MFQNIIKCWQSGLNPDPDAYKCQQMGASGAPSTDEQNRIAHALHCLEQVGETHTAADGCPGPAVLPRFRELFRGTTDAHEEEQRRAFDAKYLAGLSPHLRALELAEREAAAAALKGPDKAA